MVSNAPLYDSLIIGGGFFGLSIGLELGRSGQKVLILEAENEPMTRASMINQARVHAGYHYPRHINTALRSRANLPRFTERYGKAVDSSFTHYYAIVKDQSLVSAKQFKTTMELMSTTPLQLASTAIHRHFNLDRVEAVFEVQEPAFDALKLRDLILNELSDCRNVELRTSCRFEGSQFQDGVFRVKSSQGPWMSRRVFNCSYANLASNQNHAGLSMTPLQYELAELCLVEVPEPFKEMAFTVMCGPYFSLMPFPMKPGKHSLSHVRWTPHLSWSGGNRIFERRPKSNYEMMIRDAARYIPELESTKFSDSIFEIKALLPQNEKNDGRPILFQKQSEGRWINVLGGKLDNVFDVFESLKQEVF